MNYKLYQSGEHAEEPTVSGSNDWIMFSPHKDYLCCSIYNLILGLFCLGIPAIMLSLKARKEYQSGLFIQADKHAKNAKTLNLIGIIIGSFIILVLIAFMILMIYINLLY